MNNNINITDILRDCPKGMKLYSPIFGAVSFDYIDDTEKFSIIVKWGDNRAAAFLADGRRVDLEDTECCLFPSREMRDWRKFFKRGDVLCCPSTGYYAVFDEWFDDYKAFKAAYLWKVTDGDDGIQNGELCPVYHFKKCIKAVADGVLKILEEHYHGKYNPDTLKVEPIKSKCPFKPFDKVLVRDDEVDSWTVALFSHIDENHEEGGRVYYASGSYYYYCIPYNEHTAHLIGTKKPYTEKGGE